MQVQIIQSGKKTTGIFQKVMNRGLHSRSNSPMISGIHKRLIKTGIWINIFLCALIALRRPRKVMSVVSQMLKLRDESRGNHRILKHARAGWKYYYSMNAPGWPSRAFNRYIFNQVLKMENGRLFPGLDTVILGITKKCGYRCEHCFEWDALNKPETLTRENLLSVVQSFQRVGVTQIQLSGGEPLNRMDDIIFLLRHMKKGTEVWLYSSGYHLSGKRAALLKEAGVTGIIISLDHWNPDKHNAFRGKNNAFEWVGMAVANARAQDLLVCLSLCATREFISEKNLTRYADLARSWGISFIQVLEPEAVGHYAGKDIDLDGRQIAMLEAFYTKYNYDKAYTDYPSIVYHGFYNRRIGCGGAAKYYAYVDTDGDVHNCTFCRKKLFSALHDPLEKNIMLMKNSGCSAFVHNVKM